LTIELRWLREVFELYHERTRHPNMKIEAIHHVSLGVTDLEISRRFYSQILGLEELTRPPFDFPGAWFSAGASQ
jgi:catechol-2,3-dioxygenase